MDQVETVEIYSVPQNQELSCFSGLWKSRWPNEPFVYTKPILVHNIVLDLDIDFNF